MLYITSTVLVTVNNAPARVTRLRHGWRASIGVQVAGQPLAWYEPKALTNADETETFRYRRASDIDEALVDAMIDAFIDIPAKAAPALVSEPVAMMTPMVGVERAGGASGRLADAFAALPPANRTLPAPIVIAGLLPARTWAALVIPDGAYGTEYVRECLTAETEAAA